MPPFKTVAASVLVAVMAACSPTQPVASTGFSTELFSPAHDAYRPTQCAVQRRGTVSLNLQGLLTVNVRINGGPATLVLDTGAERSVIGPDAAKRLGVTGRYDFDRSVSGIGNSIRTGDARLASLKVGEVVFTDPRILVGPIGPLGGADGLLGADLLGDFDLDGPRRQLTLYDRTECESLRPQFPGRYATLETTRSLDHHPFFPVQIDSHRLSATFDSGAQRTAMSAAVAADIGINAAALAADPAVNTRGVGGEVLRAVLHQFRSFTLGGEAFRGPVMIVPGIALPRDSEVVIGLDFLLSRRMWLSYGSRKIFITAE